MSNSSKDQPSIRVHAPPGGHSNNIFGTDPEETHNRAATLAGQYKQTQMKSNIFGTDEPAPIRSVSNKNKSNIFGTDEPVPTRSVSNKNKSNIFGSTDDDDQNKRQSGGRQGLRVGYNPINGESYTMKSNINSKNIENDKQIDVSNKKTIEEENNNVQVTSTNSIENSNIQKTVEKSDDGNNVGYNPINGESYTMKNNINSKNIENDKQIDVSNKTIEEENNNVQVTSTNSIENSNIQKTVEKSDDGNNGQKNVHTSVRVCHPPGGKSSGPLW
ncbi:unnamed protein product [Rotaria sp. Silwood1]|nr:unnamed protein product [Rotaria sp. Silwood1]